MVQPQAETSGGRDNGGVQGDMAIRDRFRGILAGVGVAGFVHARAIDDDRETGLDPDEPVVLASVFKIAVCMELFRQVAAGEVDLAERHRIPAAGRSPGPVGLSVMSHDAELSLGDLAYLMMTISDNAATDVIMARVGLERIHATLRGLGLQRTVITGDCADLVRTMAAAAGVSGWEELAPRLGEPEMQQRLRSCQALDAATATRSTLRETTSLLAAIWRDEAGPPQVREGVGGLMAQQLCQARMAGGFPFPPWVGSKGGSLVSMVCNTAGVVDYLDGRRYAVAIFTRPSRLPGQPRGAIDQAMGNVTRLAVDHLDAAR